MRGRWNNIVVLNVHGPSEEKSDDSKNSFYEELEQVFRHFPKYHMKILLGDFNAKVGRENIFKPTIGKESLYQDSNDNGVRIVNLPHKKFWL
jgi:exonuclease III